MNLLIHRQTRDAAFFFEKNGEPQQTERRHSRSTKIEHRFLEMLIMRLKKIRKTSATETVFDKVITLHPKTCIEKHMH